jgi:2-keto-4-pentenoate hydratase/2-oxohepta-3-ene-1,7-dioic acid hydratase in catechol pathway
VSYALATLVVGSGTVPALRIDGRFWPLPASARSVGLDLSSATVGLLVDAWSEAEPVIDRIARAVEAGDVDAAIAVEADAAVLAVPLTHPRKVICIGANYADHVGRVMKKLEAMGYTRPTVPPPRPPYFMKPPSTAVVAPGGTARIPPDCEQFDWEIELTAVIGTRMSNVTPEEGLAGIMGYTVGIDFSARDFQIVPTTLFRFDLFSGKAFDASCPLGPVIVPAKFVGNPQKLQMVLSVNGEVQQDASTADMVVPLGPIVSHLSKVVTLEPGDMVLTGTPAGTGIESDRFLEPGDVVSATIEPIGTLTVDVA